MLVVWGQIRVGECLPLPNTLRDRRWVERELVVSCEEEEKRREGLGKYVD